MGNNLKKLIFSAAFSQHKTPYKVSKYAVYQAHRTFIFCIQQIKHFCHLYLAKQRPC